MPTVNKTITTDVEVEIEIDVEVYCNTCSQGMCNETDVVETRSRREQSFRVNACDKCLQKSYDEGYDEGYKKAREEFEDTAPPIS